MNPTFIMEPGVAIESPWNPFIPWAILIVAFIILELFYYFSGKGLNSPNTFKKILSFTLITLNSLIIALIFTRILGVIIGESFFN